MKSLITLVLILCASTSFAAGGAFQIYNGKLSFPDGSEFSTAPKDGKTIYNGSGAPISAATVGDFYLDTANNKLYGPYGAFGWGDGVSLVGPRGEKGDTGAAPVTSHTILFNPVNFSPGPGWMYDLSTTATNTTVLTNGNYVVPEGVYFVTIEAVGGSGGGGGGSGAGSYSSLGGGGGGGGSGEYAGTYLAVVPGSTISISYGAAGTAGAAGSQPAGPGGDGGKTIVTYNNRVYVTANGGKGGTGGNYGPSPGVGGTGGTNSSDLQHINGNRGGDGSGSSPGTGGSGNIPTNSPINIGGNGGIGGRITGEFTGSYVPYTSGTVGTPGTVAISYVLQSVL